MSVTAGPEPAHLVKPYSAGETATALLMAGATDGASRSNSPNVQPQTATAAETKAASLELLPPAQAPQAHLPAAHAACNSAELHQQLLQQLLQQPRQSPAAPAGACSQPPHSSAPAPCSSSTPAMSCPTTCEDHHEQHLLQAAAEEEEGPGGFSHAGGLQQAAPIPADHPRAWLFHLVTCPWLFKPCPSCRNNHAGREVLMTYFDMEHPSQGYCTYCPGRIGRRNLLQIRRSTYHEVIKASDISRSADIMGVQHYVINGSKVLFLRPRPQPRPPKGVVAPARCKVDGRQLMDHNSCYCSLRCKLEVEDPEFQAAFPHEALVAADAAADAAAMCGASGLAAVTAGGSSTGEQGGAAAPGGSGAAASAVPQLPRARAVCGVAVVGGKRNSVPAELPLAPRKRTASAAAAAASEGNQVDLLLSAWGNRSKRHRTVPSKYAGSVFMGAAKVLSHAGVLAVAAEGSSPACNPQQQQQQQQEDAMDFGAGVLLGLRGGGGGRPTQSPAHSGDSERSSTCYCRWSHRRKGEPVRSPLQ